MRLSVVGAILLALLIFAGGWFFGQRGAPDVTAQVDTLIVRSVRTDTLMSTVMRREIMVRATVDTLQGRIDTLLVAVREALPDTLRPVLDSLRSAQDARASLWEAQAVAWREVADSLKAERDEALRLLQVRRRKPFPVQIVAGVAVTTHGILPAVSVGLRIPLPRLF